MPSNGYDGPLTLAAGINRYLAIAQTAGYTGRFGFAYATIKNTTGASIFVARDSAVSDAGGHKGREIQDGESYTWPSPGVRGTIDFYQMYIYSAAGGEIISNCGTR